MFFCMTILAKNDALCHFFEYTIDAPSISHSGRNIERFLRWIPVMKIQTSWMILWASGTLQSSFELLEPTPNTFLTLNDLFFTCYFVLFVPLFMIRFLIGFTHKIGW